MSGMTSRRKGASGELELARLLADELGAAVERNLQQPRAGGSDLLGLVDWSVEVKRVQRFQPAMITAWWSQCETQAAKEQRRPVLCYREDRQPWRCVVRLSDLNPQVYWSWEGVSWTATISLPALAALIREGL